MYLQANPRRRKAEEEKEELKQKYRPGEEVLPRVVVQDRDSEDERMLAEVREMSLRDVDARAPGSYERGMRHRTAERRRDPTDNNRQIRRHQHADSSHQESPGGGTHRSIGHQSSLRSLMSSSEIDSSEMEEEILRLVDEGWLDGIDLDSLDTSQVDELSERIADAYRRRHRHRSRAEQSRRPQNRSRRRSPERSNNRSNRSSATAEQSHHPSRPPVSRPHLLEAYPTGHSQQRRASSEQRRQTSPSPRSASRIPSANQHQAARSATDLTEAHPRSPLRPRPAELSNRNRRPTDPDHRHRDRLRGEDQSEVAICHNTSASEDTPARSEATQAQPRSSLPLPASDPGNSNAESHQIVSEPRRNPPTIHGPLNLSSTREHTSAPAPVLYTEPSIECNRCKKQNIEYDVHYNCSRCFDGKYNLCLQCYRIGRGCLHWYGFGYAALQQYQRDAKDMSQRKDPSPPHTLIGQQYKQPEPQEIQSPRSEAGPKMVTQDPMVRLQSGAFCAICLEFANHCFWKCGSCNEGEWGFCNRCVNRSRCCSHPLLPVVHRWLLNAATSESLNSSGTTSFVPTPEHHSSSSPLFLGLSSADQYIPLSLSTKCNICEYPIPPSSTRFHCPQCNDGDFNICTNSYLKLVSDGRISADNGDKGWRRCPSGHRMIIVGFEDSPAGQRRVVVRDLVGGHGLKNDGNSAEQSMKQEWSWQDGQQRYVWTVSKQVSSVSESQDDGTTAGPLLRRYPPSGGIGMRVLALWTYLPGDEAQDDLSFPKGAEIQEAENINGDWFVGCYAGKSGLFPGNYVRVLDIVKA
ncbi:MAG: hypothetical protein LQ343_002153 [Gyalolechia ehrenbergii]|nr:MAG: hypothetical protein LQ343_002153 [Gyalolechia ehrenbergii]